MLRFRTVNVLFAVVFFILVPYGLMIGSALIAIIIAAFTYLAVLAYGAFVLSAEFFIPVKFRGDGHFPAIAITFDDGPVAGGTEKILDILQAYAVPAAFFCIGKRVTENPALARRIHAAGHLVGNHSYWHNATFDLQPAARIEKELSDTNKVIQETIGVRPNFFRPPYGVTNPMVAKAITRGGYKTIGWSVRSFDTVIHDPMVWMRRATKSLKAGDIVLFHDYSKTTQDSLPRFIDHVHKIGLKIVRVDELLNENGYATGV